MRLIFGIFLLVMCVLPFLFTGGESARGISHAVRMTNETNTVHLLLHST